MLVTQQLLNVINFNEIPLDANWGSDAEKELLMHRIHHYPAKFKHFVISKSLEYAKRDGKHIALIGDIFCGCGTTALEAKRRGIDFWGCDINPVATLIAKVKSQQYDEKKLRIYYEDIIEQCRQLDTSTFSKLEVNKRVKYWFNSDQILGLNKLIFSIRETVPKGKYRNFFLVGFSNILKGTSNWLAKSVKPQKDPSKIPQNVMKAFERQILMMRKANREAIDDYKPSSQTKIITSDFLKLNYKWPKLDIIITSPPYVTSYDYADLHQLSALWLDYVDDYRDLRKGSIGSKQTNFDRSMLESIETSGRKTFDALATKDIHVAKSVAKYFIDMDKALQKAYELLNFNGLAFFIIGNTTYFQIEVNNAKFIAESMAKYGFQNINIIKRKISSKILTPFRDAKGKFSSSRENNEVYPFEYIVIGKKTRS